MTLTSVLTKLSFSGNGTTTVFAVSFVYYDDNGLRVILVNDTTGVETVQTITTQYTLSGGSGATGTLTMLTAPASGETLIIKSNIDDIQETDFPTGGNLRSTSIEQQMDILTRLVQQKEEQISRMLILKESTALSDLAFPNPTALGVIRWNAAATALEITVGLSSGTFIEDADSDTKIQVEESSDEDIIRFDVAGTQIANMTASAITFSLPVSITGAVTVSSTVDGRDLATDGTKLDTIETSATGDQTGAEIKTLYEAQTNAFTDAQFTKLTGIETAATGDQTGTEIKTLYEAETNAFTDTKNTKLSGIETSADVTDTANVTAAGALMDSEVDADLKTFVLPASTTISTFGATLVDDTTATLARATLGVVIGTDVLPEISLVTQAVAEAGTATAENTWSALRVKQAIEALETSSSITLATEQATTSGTTFDFTGITSGVKRIIMILNGVSLSGTDNLLVQIGDSGGIETTGYISTAMNPASAIASTTGFIIRASEGTRTISGQIIFTRMNSSALWIASHSVKVNTVQISVGGGDKTLSAELTQIRLTRTGSDTFDAGSVTITYEV